MQNYIRQFLNNTDAAYDEFAAPCNLLADSFSNELCQISNMWKETRKIADTMELRNQLSQKSGVHIYTVNAAVVIAASKWLHDEYRQKGIADDIFWDTMSDLKCKLDECKQVKGVYGTFVEDWYDGIFDMSIFKLGRFEYQVNTFDEDTPCTIGSYTLNKGDRVYSIHIPSGSPMPLDVRLDSYKKAYEFFGRSPIVLMCKSWLIYSKNKEIFPPHLNLVSFGDDFHHLWDYTDENYSNCWRIFGVEYDGNPDNLPCDNTPRKAMVKWLKSGNKPGGGKGVFVFDGEKIIK